MLLYRVIPYLASAPIGSPGHPGYVHSPQQFGRLDNPSHYTLLYLSESKSGAVGETLAQFPVWTKTVFDFKKVPGSRLALCTFQLPDPVRFLDMDDARVLHELGL